MPQDDGGRKLDDVVPGLAVGMAVLGFNLVGDGLREALDPTLERGR